jgi:membrane protease YdiL (CAAX protease family)
MAAEDHEPDKAASAEPALNARSATFILLVFLGAQVGVGMFLGVVAVVIAAISSSDHAEVLQRIMAPGIVVTFIVSGAAMLLMAFSRVRQHLFDTSSTGAAWVFGSRKHCIQGLGVGVLSGCYFYALAVAVPRSAEKMGTLTKMADTPGLQQSMWLLTALVFAPVIEELLFRGVMYAGYRKSLGPVRAALLTTFIFWAIHITETIYSWPAMVVVAGMAIAALWIRLRSAAIGPAVALHFGYNFVVSVGVVYSSWR